jgi:hypothetical protein
VLLAYHMSILAEHLDVPGSVAAAAAAEQLIVAAAGGTVVTSSCQSGEIEGLPHTVGQVRSSVQEVLHASGKQQQPGWQLLQQALQVALLASHARAAAYRSVLKSWQYTCNSVLLSSTANTTASSSCPRVAEAATRSGSDSSDREIKKQAQCAANMAALVDLLPTEQQLLDAVDMQLSLFQAVQQHVQTAERPQLLGLLAASVKGSVHELSVHREVWEAAQGISRQERLQSASPAVLTVQQAATTAERLQAAARASGKVTAALLPHLLACRVAVGGPAAASLTGRGSNVGSAVACVLGSEYLAVAEPIAAIVAAVEVGAMMLLMYQDIQGDLQMLGPGSICASIKANHPAATSSGSSSHATAATANSSSSSSQVAGGAKQQQEQLWQCSDNWQYPTRDEVATAPSVLRKVKVGSA